MLLTKARYGGNEQASRLKVEKFIESDRLEESQISEGWN
jgi:hypothetical protein